MLLVAHIGLAINFAFLKFLQIPVLPLTRLFSPLLACFVGDILHVDRAMVAGVRREKTIVAVWWVDWRSLPREEQS
jgi:hypothetical protein